MLYALLDPEVAPRGDVLALADAVLRGGAAWVQLRAKRLPDGETLALARALRELTRGCAQLWMNDRADLAVLCQADGLHVGQEDLPVADARRVLRPGQRIGVSTHDLGQVREAVAAGADVVAYGPVFPSGTKSGHAQVTGVEVLREVAALAAGRPVVAIGGITVENAGACRRAGATHVAVIGALAHAADPEQAARALAQAAQ
ncbi:MAG: thiamine phosphate synthase [Deltaproteobacteria bacterium]|nr:thiamine phosphate synthase [Deltaproteobacteria bacterium]